MTSFSIRTAILLLLFTNASLISVVGSNETSSDFSDPQSEVSELLRLSLNDIDNNNLNKATERLDKVISLAEKTKDEDVLALAHLIKGQVHQARNQNRKARDSFERSLQFAKKTENRALTTSSLKELADVNADMNNFDDAYGYYKQYADLKEHQKLRAVQDKFLDEKEKLEKQNSQVKLQMDNLEEESILKDIHNKQIIDSMEQVKLQTDLVLAQKKLELKDSEILLQKEAYARNILIAIAALAGVVLLFVFYSYNNKRRANEKLAQKNSQIRVEKKRSEDLLLNILPKDIADELKANGKVKPKHYENVSVFFTDFISFTSIAESLTPEDLVQDIDTCFQEFDRIIGKYNLEKIKTIGDAYMCVGGLPVPNSYHHTNVVKAGLEIQSFLRKLKRERIALNKSFFEARIGIHSGSVVAGIVGSRKFAYDIWGDTVNTAARIESAGEAGKVNISEDTYKLIKDEFNCEYRGMIEVKNKGEIGMYFVERIKT